MPLRFLLFLLFIGFATAATAQTSEDDARDDLRYGNRGREQTFDRGGDLWYGGGLILDYQSRFGESLFRVGVTPMVGYKLNNFLSVGPRASLVYNAYGAEFQGLGRVKSRNWSYAIGAFSRAKLFRGVFAQAEYSLLSDVVITGIDQTTNQFRELRSTRAVPFLGAGFSNGGGPGGVGFEIAVMFRLTQPDRLNDTAYEIRTGLNYNF